MGRPMTAAQRSEGEMLRLELANTLAIESLVSRDPARAREAAARARAVAEELFARSGELAERAVATRSTSEIVNDYLRITKTAIILSRVARDIEDELEYRYPRRPVYL
jgi:hypothetical protein